MLDHQDIEFIYKEGGNRTGVLTELRLNFKLVEPLCFLKRKGINQIDTDEAIRIQTGKVQD